MELKLAKPVALDEHYEATTDDGDYRIGYWPSFSKQQITVRHLDEEGFSDCGAEAQFSLDSAESLIAAIRGAVAMVERLKETKP